MTYMKPEISTLGDAASVILNGTKPFGTNLDPFIPTEHMMPAYDLDE